MKVKNTSDQLVEDTKNHHAPMHEDGGVDEISLASLSGDPADTINESLMAAKGDLITASADNTPSLLSVGANGEFLIPNSAKSNGLEWVSLVAFEDHHVLHGDETVYV